MKTNKEKKATHGFSYNLKIRKIFHHIEPEMIKMLALSIHLALMLSSVITVQAQQQYHYQKEQEPVEMSSNSYEQQQHYGGAMGGGYGVEAGGGGGGGGGYSGGYGGYGGGDSRPKLQLGLRVKIPAMKFELPRMSLPKITISAKIRQPNRPRTINLPEINLDTSSALEKNDGYGSGGGRYGGGDGGHSGYRGGYGSGGGGGYGGQGGYGAASSYNKNYQSQHNSYESDFGPAKTQTFSISSSSEDEYTSQHPGSYGSYQNQNQNNNHHQQKQSSHEYGAGGGVNHNNNMHYSSTDSQAISLHPDNEFSLNNYNNNNNHIGIDRREPISNLNRNLLSDQQRVKRSWFIPNWGQIYRSA